MSIFWVGVLFEYAMEKKGWGRSDHYVQSKWGGGPSSELPFLLGKLPNTICWEFIKIKKGNTNLTFLPIFVHSNPFCNFFTSHFIKIFSLVRYCNGRGWYGRIISVSPSNDEELQQIIEESKIAGPDKGPERLGRRKNIEDEIYNDENRNDFDEDNSDFVFGGLDNYSDSGK